MESFLSLLSGAGGPYQLFELLSTENHWAEMVGTKEFWDTQWDVDKGFCFV